MAKKRIPGEIRAQVDAIVEQFNEQEMPSRRGLYIPRYRGNYLYLDRKSWGGVIRICRLKYNGAMDNWGFSIFKHSNERYASDEWFPSDEHIDGTVKGAMRAGMGAYPA